MRVIGELVARPEVLRERTAAALARVPAEPRAVVGHCFGGLAALELARSGAEVYAAVSFHGRLATLAPAERGRIHARVLACTGADDPHCPRDQRAAFEDEMTAAGVDWQHHVYGGARHGFTIAGPDHDEAADRRSWRAMLDLLY
jgi:dienelactone hydrolase